MILDIPRLDYWRYSNAIKTNELLDYKVSFDYKDIIEDFNNNVLRVIENDNFNFSLWSNFCGVRPEGKFKYKLLRCQVYMLYRVPSYENINFILNFVFGNGMISYKPNADMTSTYTLDSSFSGDDIKDLKDNKQYLPAPESVDIIIESATTKYFGFENNANFEHGGLYGN